MYLWIHLLVKLIRLFYATLRSLFEEVWNKGCYELIRIFLVVILRRWLLSFTTTSAEL